MPWRARSDDPTARLVLVERHAHLAAAARAPLADRSDRIVELCRGRRVLDVGCVDHRFVTHEGATWLHRRIVAVASSCVGVDIEPAGIAAMADAGYDVVLHDVCTGAGPVAHHAPFDVVVAGEVIEHLAAPQALFEFAAAVLEPGGILVVTTPNPYAPHRVRSGQLGLTWENADHVVYAFPAGVIELGERTGFTLQEYRTVSGRPLRSEIRRSFVKLAVALRNRWIRGQRPATDPESVIVPALEQSTNPFELALIAATRTSRFLGETSFYVLRRDVAAGFAQGATARP